MRKGIKIIKGKKYFRSESSAEKYKKLGQEIIYDKDLNLYYLNRTHKYCNGCNRLLKIDQFRKSFTMKYYESKCRECKNKYQLEYARNKKNKSL